MIRRMTDWTMRPARCLSLAMLIAVAPLVACHKSDTAPAADTTTAAATSTAAAPGAAPAVPASPVKVVALTIGKAVGADNKVTTEADTIAPSDTAYAAVGTTGTSPAKLTARWSYVARSGAEKPMGEESKSITPTGDATTEFHLVKPEGLTTGDYKIEILLDGQSVATKAFRVAK